MTFHRQRKNMGHPDEHRNWWRHLFIRATYRDHVVLRDRVRTFAIKTQISYATVETVACGLKRESMIMLKKNGENICMTRRTSCFLALRSFLVFTGLLFQIKLTLHLLNTTLLNGCQELWHPLSKAVPGKFHGSGWDNKHSCSQDLAKFYKTRVWKIVIIQKL